MKKKKIWYIISGLLLLFGLSIWASYKFRPEWFDKENIYHKVYDYEVIKDLKPQKAIIKDIEIEIIHKDTPPQILNQEDWEESDSIGWRRPINYNLYFLTVSLDSGEKLTLPIEINEGVGPGFNNSLPNLHLYNKLSLRFPGMVLEEEDDIEVLDQLLMLHTGDTLFQADTNFLHLARFKLKNPETGQLQTYYEYSKAAETPSHRTRYFIQGAEASPEERQAFFDDYNPNAERNYWDRRWDYDVKNEIYPEKQSYYYMLFYSDRLTNIPLSISTTGSEFKTTIRHTYFKEENEVLWQYSETKTYNEENKHEYIKEILNQY
ncbi:TPA: hypothetical protein U2D59_001130, partial [Streptococcus suis]|uniref:hypothetical protein n=1 Tax=Streptococcus suis TaxID=1307 RepID=UPI0005CD74A4|nr:hypothetical protein [Streptococcus suis]MDW8767860.1 hypothetical protein [Streptococcus suis]NQH06822.1 hypothetical protein [Streptococcus suis]NQR70780.1 hypothetical protein [Streptococcus suis]HEL1950728.1 hypothetical protein [Streptococcus suis]HEL2726159.1 hypothetical protein [Streptococcus suis]